MGRRAGYGREARSVSDHIRPDHYAAKALQWRGVNEEVAADCAWIADARPFNPTAALRAEFALLERTRQRREAGA